MNWWRCNHSVMVKEFTASAVRASMTTKASQSPVLRRTHAS